MPPGTGLSIGWSVRSTGALGVRLANVRFVGIAMTRSASSRRDANRIGIGGYKVTVTARVDGSDNHVSDRADGRKGWDRADGVGRAGDRDCRANGVVSGVFRCGSDQGGTARQCRRRSGGRGSGRRRPWRVVAGRRTEGCRSAAGVDRHLPRDPSCPE